MVGRAAHHRKDGLGARDLPQRTVLINHVWMTRLDDALYSGLDDLGGVEEDLEVSGLGGAEPVEDGEGLP